MVDTQSTLIAIAMMGLIVYATRLTGYFVGLQLRFDDEDLKPLIPLGAVALPR